MINQKNVLELENVSKNTGDKIMTENTYNEKIEKNMKRSRGRPKIHTDVPSHLVCSITGIRVKTTPIQFRKSLEKSGLDRDTFLNTYVSRQGRKHIKENISESTIDD